MCRHFNKLIRCISGGWWAPQLQESSSTQPRLHRTQERWGVCMHSTGGWNSHSYHFMVPTRKARIRANSPASFHEVGAVDNNVIFLTHWRTVSHHMTQLGLSLLPHLPHPDMCPQVPLTSISYTSYPSFQSRQKRQLPCESFSWSICFSGEL